MHGTDKNRSEHNPEKGGDPAPDDADGWSDDRAGACDGGEMVTEHDHARGGDVIDVVSQSVRGDDAFGGEFENSVPQPATVGVVGREVEEEDQNRENKRKHGVEKS